MTGDIIPYLLQKRYATETQIADALAKPLPMRDALIATGVHPVHIAEAWAVETGHPLVDLSKFQPEQAAVRSIPDYVARRHNVIPIKKDGNVLYVAMPDPNNLQAADDLRLMSRSQIKGIVADPEQIRAAIETYYGGAA